MKDHEHPFFRPLWRRIAVVAVCVAWAALEFASGSHLWGFIMLGFAAYGFWQFFYLYKPAAEIDAAESPDAGEAQPKE